MAQERLQVVLQLVAGQYKSEAKQAASATGQVGKSATAAGTATGGLGAKMAKVQGSMLAMAGGALAAKKGFDATVGAFANFDDKMNESLAIMGDVSDAMRQEMSDAAREVAKATTFSADQAAESYFFLASAGLDAAAAVEAMPAVAQFAQAGMFDMATATDLATDAQSALGLASDDAATNLQNLTRVTDVFVKANTLANTSVQQISEAMTTRAGAALRALNKDVEEGAAVLAALADQGVKGAQAGTQLGIVLRDLQTKALSNADAFEQAGISVFDAEGNMRNIADVLGDVEGRMGGMSDAAKRAELAQLGFSDRSIAVLTTLLGTSDAIREYESELRDAGGTTEEVADKQLQSAKAQWELFKSALADVGLELGENTLPLLEETIPLLQDMAEILGTLSELSGPAFENPLPEDMAQRAKDAAKETGLWERAVIMAGEAAARFTPEGRVMAGQLSDAEQAARDVADANEVAAESFHDMSDEARMGAKGIEPVREAFSTLGGEMNQVPTGPEMSRFFRELGEDAGNSAPGLREMAEATRAVASAMREAADPVFAAVESMKRLREAEDEYQETLDDPEATGEDVKAAWLDIAAARLDANAALSELGAGNKEAGIRAIADALEISYGQAKNLLGTWIEFDEAGNIEKVVDISANISPADQALLNQATRGDLTVNTGTASPHNLGRQHGGPVMAGHPYIVGEAGREMFVPETNGTVLSAADTKRLLSGSDTSSSGDTHLHFHSSGDITGDVGTAVTMAGLMRRVETARR